MNPMDEKWVLCPVCGAKTRLRLLQRTVLRDFPLFCPKCNKGVRVGFKVEGDKKTRICRKCGSEI